MSESRQHTPHSEVGHRYLDVLHGAKSTQIYQNLPIPSRIDPVIAQLMQIMSNPSYKLASKGLFLSGRVYDEQRGLDGQVEFRHLSQWRQEVAEIVDAVAVPLHGLEMSLHQQDAGAGAGLAFLRMLVCPTLIVDARGRLGHATIEEAKIARSLGHRVGFLLTEEDHQQAQAYLRSGEGDFPDCLPAYWSTLTNHPRDLIRGELDILRWLDQSRREQSVYEMQDRAIPSSYLALIWHYVASQLEDRERDLDGLKKVVAQPLK